MHRLAWHFGVHLCHRCPFCVSWLCSFVQHIIKANSIYTFIQSSLQIYDSNVIFSNSWQSLRGVITSFGMLNVLPDCEYSKAGQIKTQKIWTQKLGCKCHHHQHCWKSNGIVLLLPVLGKTKTFLTISVINKSLTQYISHHTCNQFNYICEKTSYDSFHMHW